MLKSKKLQNLTQISEIRRLEKTMAEQALNKAKMVEDERHRQKESAETELQTAEEKWERCLSDGSIISEHLKYYSDDLVVQLEKQTIANNAYSVSVKMSEDKMQALQICNVIAKKTNQMQHQLRRKIQRDKDERAVIVFEDRFSYDWSRK